MGEKDRWDKAEVIGKIAGAVLIPVTVGIAASVISHQSSQRSTAAQMAQIAVGILSLEPSEDEKSGSTILHALESDPLREWAIEVLQNPSEVTPLSAAAAKQLHFQNLPTLWGSPLFWGSEEALAEGMEIIDRLKGNIGAEGAID